MANDNLVNILKQALAAFGPNGENWTQGKEAYRRPKCCVTLSFTADNQNALEESEIDEGCAALAEVLGISPDDLEPWNDAPKRTWLEVKSLFEKAIESAPGTDRYEVRG